MLDWAAPFAALEEGLGVSTGEHVVTATSTLVVRGDE